MLDGFDGLYGLEVFSLLAGVAFFMRLVSYLQQMFEILSDIGGKKG